MTTTLSHALRSFILAENRFIPSHIKYKRVLLSGLLCIVAASVCIVYVIFGIITGIRTMWPVLIICTLISIISFALNRSGHHMLANVLLATSSNFAIFIVCLIEPFESGGYSYFIVCGLGVLAAFGYKERKKAIFFVALSTVLFLTAIVLRFDVITDQSYTADYIRTNIIINFLISLLAALLIIYFLINVNHRSEAVLRNNEQQIQVKNQELTKLNTELDRFVYSTSHDLRAPINSMQGLIQLTRMTEDMQEVRDYVTIMENRLASLIKFIGDISDYARNARIELNHHEIDINLMVDDVLEGLRFYPGANKLRIIRDTEECAKVYADKVRLHIILSNLISNAFKYADLRKDDAFLKIAAKRNGAAVTLIVTDNGVGISNQYLPRIFDMFFQATDKSEGSGLGLYIVKEAVDKMNGKIFVTSQQGVGSEFIMQIPVVVEAGIDSKFLPQTNSEECTGAHS